MSRASLPHVPLLAVAALGLAACSDLDPNQPGMFANDPAAAGGRMAQAGNTRSAEQKATGFASGAMVTATVNVITKYQASERQRQVAQGRARTAVKRLRVEEKRVVAAATKTKSTAKPSGTTAMKTREVDVTQMPKKVPRYIAVDTVKDERTSPKAAKAVMIFDTQTQEIVGNDVYDVRSTPPVGGTARFETFTAEYVGTGS